MGKYVNTTDEYTICIILELGWLRRALTEPTVIPLEVACVGSIRRRKGSNIAASGREILND